MNHLPNLPFRETHIWLNNNYESALLLLFSVCMMCKKMKTVIQKNAIGSFAKITQYCKSCTYKHTWESQPYIIIGNVPAGNILTSAAILYTGSLPSKQPINLGIYLPICVRKPQIIFGIVIRFVRSWIADLFTVYRFILIRFNCSTVSWCNTIVWGAIIECRSSIKQAWIACTVAGVSPLRHT